MKKLPFIMMSVIAFLAFSPSFSQNQIFIYFETGAGRPPITGESIAKDHLNETEILSLLSGFSSLITMSSATSGAGTGKATFSDIKFTKMVGKSSAPLLASLCTGSQIPKAEIRYYTVNNLKANKYLVLTLENVFVSGIEHNGSVNEKPTESISLAYGKITWNYYEADVTGLYKLVSTTSWNRITNTTQ